MKKVLYLIETSGPGGAENMLINLAGHLDRERYEPMVCLLKEGWLATQLRQRGLETVTVPQRPGYDVGWIFRCARLIRERQVSVVHTHEFAMNAYGSLAALMAGARIVATVHGGSYYHEKWRRRLAYRMVARRAVRLVAVSESIRRILVEQVGAPPAKVSTIYNGIEVDAHGTAEDRARIRRECDIDDSSPVVATIANLYPVKGHTFLLKAAARVAQVHPDAVWLLAGRGNLLSSLQDEAKELGIIDRVRFLGFRDDAGAILQASDLFVLPSLSEGLPLSVLEAMAAGKPVVATAVGGNPEAVVDGETGCLVPAGDPGALAGSMIELLGNRALAARYGAAGRRRAQELFSVEKMVSRYQDLYEGDAAAYGT